MEFRVRLLKRWVPSSDFTHYYLVHRGFFHSDTSSFSGELVNKWYGVRVGFMNRVVTMGSGKGTGEAFYLFL